VAFFFVILRPSGSTLFPYTTLFRSGWVREHGRRRVPVLERGSEIDELERRSRRIDLIGGVGQQRFRRVGVEPLPRRLDRGRVVRSEERRVGKEWRCGWWGEA